MVSATGAVAGDLVLVVADEWRTACEVLGQLRLDLGRPPVGQGERRFLWVTEFPLFDGTDDDGNPQAAHHPFTMPHPDDLDLLAHRPACGALPGLRPRPQRLGARVGVDPYPPRGHPAPGLRRAGHPPRGGRGPLRVPARGLPLRRAAPRRASPWASTGSWRCWRGRTTSARSSPIPKTQSGTDPMTGAPKALPERALRELGPARHARGRLSPTAGDRERATHGQPVAASPGAGRARPLRPGGRGPAPPARPAGGAPAAPHPRRHRRPAPSGGARRPAAGPDRAGPPDLGHLVGPGGDGKDHPGPGGGGHHGQDLRAAVGGERRRGRRARGHRRGPPAARRAGPGDHPLHRRGPPFQQVAAGRAAARGGRGARGAHRRHHREPLLRGQLAAAQPGDAVAPRAAGGRRHRRGDPARARGRGGRRADDDAVAAMVSVADGDARAALGHPRGGRGPGRGGDRSPSTVVERARAGRLLHQGRRRPLRPGQRAHQVDPGLGPRRRRCTGSPACSRAERTPGSSPGAS